MSECKPKKEVSSNRRKQQSEKLKEKIAKVEEEYWGEDWEAASNDNLMDFKNEDELKGKTLS